MCVCGWFVEWRAGQGAGRKVRDSADQAKPTEETKLSEDPDMDDTQDLESTKMDPNLLGMAMRHSGRLPVRTGSEGCWKHDLRNWSRFAFPTRLTQ